MDDVRERPGTKRSEGVACCGTATQEEGSGSYGPGRAMSPEKVKELVRKAYGRIGAGVQSGCGCCGNAAGAQNAATALGYGAEDLAGVPQGANLGLGCGNPIAIAGLQPGETVLDLGSGGGFDAFLAARRVGLAGKVIGVDMTPEMIQRARDNAQRGGYVNVEFRQGEIEALPIADASIDVVLSNCVLNLVPDKARAFAEIARVLKPGGRMMVSDVVLARPLPPWLREQPGAYVGCVSGAVLKEEYLRLIGQAGLEQVTVLEERDASDLLLGSCCSHTAPALVGERVDEL
ncbi:MAG: arsenite methyltransferase, partial [Armatimonadota bacterium]|nr:arsenite methyltransferase [Armatimonadota bacterium]